MTFAATLSDLIYGGKNVDEEGDSRRRLGELSDLLASLYSLLLHPPRLADDYNGCG